MSEKLAIHGGPKAVTNSLKGWPSFDEKAIQSVEQVLRSGKVNYWTGRRGMEFERRFAEWQGSKHAGKRRIIRPMRLPGLGSIPVRPVRWTNGIVGRPHRCAE